MVNGLNREHFGRSERLTHAVAVLNVKNERESWLAEIGVPLNDALVFVVCGDGRNALQSFGYDHEYRRY